VIIQTGPNFRVDPMAMRGWVDAQPVPPGVVLDDLSAFPTTELVEAHRDRYVWTHEDWCAAPISLPAVTAHAEATVAVTRRELSSGARVGDRLAALAMVIDEPGGGLMLISETVRRTESHGVAVVAAVVADALRRLADAGVRDVELDGHVTDPHLHPVTRSFPPDVRSAPLHVARLS
jgi:hypothetical protein